MISVKVCDSFGHTALSISTGSETWLYGVESGGFGSLIDKDGVEWIGFAPGDAAFPIGAANVFRGMPNLVFPNNIGHPGYRTCSSTWKCNDNTATLSTKSLDGEWEWVWTVRSGAARLDMLSTPEDRCFWFLYEGTPGGRYDRENAIWGNDRFGRASSAPPLTHPNTGSWRWTYFGDTRTSRVLAFAHLTSREEPSICGWMAADGTGRDGMAVFGFGRTQENHPIPHLRGAHSFKVQLIESTDHRTLAETLNAVLAEEPTPEVI